MAGSLSDSSRSRACPARLIVELDGPIHDFEKPCDAERDAWLARQGYPVLRMRNGAVKRDLPSVLARLTQACES
jgi:very-short-patch-repair endonuclease